LAGKVRIKTKGAKEKLYMSKIRSDSKWGGLPEEQRETLEGWLFEENLGYGPALERAEKEFGVKGSVRSLAEYYQRRARERLQDELNDTEEIIDQLHSLRGERDDLEATAIALMAKRMVQLSVDSPNNVTELVSIGRVLAAIQAQDIKRRWLEIGEGRYEAEVRGPDFEEARAKRYLEAIAKEDAKLAARRAEEKLATQEPDEKDDL
jgi:hypothetical protein